jgi:TfoX/Sxy family transcriptional regulator of competence genes
MRHTRGGRVYSPAMGCRVIGRGVLLGALALGGCASSPRRDPANEAELRAAVVAVYEAVARGDEAAYRQLVQMPAGDAYSDALTSTMFESIRLHQAVTRTTAPSTRPVASLAAVDYRENARAMLKAVQGWTFTVRGDRATIDQLEAKPGAPTLRRVEGRWVLAPTQWDTRRDTATYRLAVAQERALAAALAQARAAVDDGAAKSVEDVNAILRKLLTEPTTQP